MSAPDLDATLSVETSRRWVLTTGAKLTYAAPVIAATMSLKARHAGAVSICSAIACTNDFECPNVGDGSGACVTLREAVDPSGNPTVGICRTNQSPENCFFDTDCNAGQRCVDRANVDNGIGICLHPSGGCATNADCASNETCVALYPGGPDTSLPVTGPGVCVASCD